MIFASLKSALAGLIDYAGLFPPAKLDLPSALADYYRHIGSNHAWLVSRFLCPSTQLSELAELLNSKKAQRAGISLAVTAGGGQDKEEFLAKLNADFLDIVNFIEKAKGQATIRSVELKTPVSGMIKDNEGFKSFLQKVYHALQSSLGTVSGGAGTPVGANIVKCFFEPSFANPIAHEKNWKEGFGVLIEALDETNQTLERESSGALISPLGFKMRTGGTRSEDFPGVEQVAFAIAACRDFAVPFKATAGLHQPFRHYDSDIKVHHHGFLSLFVALILARVCHLQLDMIADILREERLKNIIFKDTGLMWRGFTVTNQEIKLTRENFATSFGSCSIDEPVEHLRNLLLL